MKFDRTIKCVVAMAATVILSNAGALAATTPAAAPGPAEVPMPTGADMAKPTAEIKSGDPAQVDLALKQIYVWVDGGRPVRNVWVEWVPDLMKAGRNQEAAALALEECIQRPAPEAIVPTMELRVNALLALNQTTDALAAAKQYYNVCDMKLTGGAVALVGQCLARAHPEDADITRRFRGEQVAASTLAAAAAVSASPDQAGTTQPSGILSAVVLDEKPWDDAIKTWSTKTEAVDRVGYGNILLVVDRGADAEKVFRDLYQHAATPADKTVAAEGIAKSLRTEDGNLSRANAWLIEYQKQSAAKP